ncbi:MAG: T9SS type A sorting domain-containing protein [Bacteroidales bacterium]
MFKNKSSLLLCLLVAAGVSVQGQVRLSVIQPPELSADAGNDSIVCRNHSVTLGGSPSASGGSPGYIYLWTPSAGLDDPTSPNPEATPESTTTYRLTVTDQNGCQAESEVLIRIDQCLGIGDRPLIESFSVYPNPSSGQFVVAGINQELAGQLSLELVNRIGQVVYRKQYLPDYNPVGIRVDAAPIDPGVYLLRIYLKDNILTSRLIIR